MPLSKMAAGVFGAVYLLVGLVGTFLRGQAELIGEMLDQRADRSRHAAAVRAQRSELQRLEQLFQALAVDVTGRL